MPLTDTHCHLDDRQFADDLDAVLDRAAAAGVTRVIAVAIDSESCAACVRLAEERPGVVLATAGLHPNGLTGEPANARDEVRRWVRHASVVAIGETGLDRYRDRTPFAMQEEFFAWHLELARAERLPVVIHCREADADVLRMLRDDFDRHGPIRGVVHSFAGGAELAEGALAMGLHLSFSGTLTYKDADAIRRAAASAPADRILVETDAPYLTPVPLRGKQRRNEPGFVAHTAACLALTRGLPVGELADLTTRNADALFRRG